MDPAHKAKTIHVSRDGVMVSLTVSEAMKETKVKGRSDIPSLAELRPATLAWFQANKPEMCKPKLVVDFEAREWGVLFTPPYCPDLQPIELFWACGKNHARWKHPEHSRDVETCVHHLRDGWYGNKHDAPPKAKVDCAGLVRTAIQKANERAALDPELEGTVEGGLKVVGECELEEGVDLCGRVVRFRTTEIMPRRAGQGGAAEDVAVSGTGARGDSDAEGDDSGESSEEEEETEDRGF